jgi:hypothetical protein
LTAQAEPATDKVIGIIDSITTGSGEIEIIDGKGNKKTLKINDAPILMDGDRVDMALLRTGNTVTVDMDETQQVRQIAVAD